MRPRFVLALAISGSLVACAVDDDADRSPIVDEEESLGAVPAVDVITGEDPVEPATTGFTGERGREPDIARSAGRTMVVWRDDRTDRSSDIYGARVGEDGSILDPRGFLIAGTPDEETNPVVAPLAANRWLVAWSVGRDIAAATVTGTVVTQLGVIAGTPDWELYPSLATDGAVGVLAWVARTSFGPRVRAARYDSAGFSAPFVVSNLSNVDNTATDGPITVAAGASGDPFLIVWFKGNTTSSGGLVSAHVPQTGPPHAAAGFRISTNTFLDANPDATFDGTNWVVAWERHEGPGAAIWGARVGGAPGSASYGRPIDTTPGVSGGVVIATAIDPSEPAVSCDPTTCQFAWQSSDNTSPDMDVYAQLRTHGFAPVGGPFTINAAIRSQKNIAMAPRATGGQLVVFDDQAVGIHSVSLVRIGGSGTVEDPTPLLVNTQTVSSQRRPAFARSPAGQLAVWSDTRVFGSDIMARRYTANGAKLGGSAGARVISDAANEQVAPAINFDGTQYLVAWTDFRTKVYGVVASRFTDAGVNLDPDGIVLSAPDDRATAPAIASGGGVSMVIWASSDAPAMRGAIVRPDGTFTRFEFCAGGGTACTDPVNPAVAWDPTNAVFVVAYTRAQVVCFVRVSADGVLLDSESFIGGVGSRKTNVSIASSGDQLLLVWDDYRTATKDNDVYAARLSATGGLHVVGAPVPVATGTAIQKHPTVGALSNGRWSLAWEDHGNAATAGSDIVGNEMLPSGALAGPQYTIAASTWWETGPKLETGPNTSNTTYLIYQRDGGAGHIRSMRRKLTYLP